MYVSIIFSFNPLKKCQFIVKGLSFPWKSKGNDSKFRRHCDTLKVNFQQNSFKYSPEVHYWVKDSFKLMCPCHWQNNGSLCDTTQSYWDATALCDCVAWQVNKKRIWLQILRCWRSQVYECWAKRTNTLSCSLWTTWGENGVGCWSSMRLWRLNVKGPVLFFIWSIKAEEEVVVTVSTMKLYIQHCTVSVQNTHFRGVTVQLLSFSRFKSRFGCSAYCFRRRKSSDA